MDADTEAAAYQQVEQRRWPNGATCAHCGSTRVFFLRPADGTTRRTRTGTASPRRVWKCGACRRQFSALTGTILQGTKIPLRVWLDVIDGIDETLPTAATLRVRHHLSRSQAEHIAGRLRHDRTSRFALLAAPAHAVDDNPATRWACSRLAAQESLDLLRDLLLSRQLPPGNLQLEAVADKLEVSTTTAQRRVWDLVDEGWLERSGRGFVVRTPEERPPDSIAALLTARRRLLAEAPRAGGVRTCPAGPAHRWQVQGDLVLADATTSGLLDVAYVYCARCGLDVETLLPDLTIDSYTSSDGGPGATFADQRILPPVVRDAHTLARNAHPSPTALDITLTPVFAGDHLAGVFIGAPNPPHTAKCPTASAVGHSMDQLNGSSWQNQHSAISPDSAPGGNAKPDPEHTEQ